MLRKAAKEPAAHNVASSSDTRAPAVVDAKRLVVAEPSTRSNVRSKVDISCFQHSGTTDSVGRRQL